MIYVRALLLVIGTAALWWGIFGWQKTEEKLNGMVWAVASAVILLAYGTCAAGILAWVRIPVTAEVMGAVYLLTAAILIWKNRKNGRQAYAFFLYDIFVVAGIGAAIFLLMRYYYSPELYNGYSNSDAAIQFRAAMEVYRGHRLSGMYFAPLHTALFLQAARPFLQEITLYKGFIVFDNVMAFLETAFFFALIRKYLRRPGTKAFAVVLTAMYFGGYPLNSYIFTFYYWPMGTMLVMGLLFLLDCYGTKGYDRRFVVVCLMLFCASVTVCYAIFAPCAYVLVLLGLIRIRKDEGRLFSKENVLLALKIFLLPCVISVYYCYFGFMKVNEVSVAEAMAITGGIYNEPYINFIWTAPFAVYACIRAFKQRKEGFDNAVLFTLGYAAFSAAMLVLHLAGSVSAYYYYKTYLPVWTLFFVLAMASVADLWERERELLAAFFSIFAVIALLHFGGIELRVGQKSPELMREGVNRSGSLFDIYAFNDAWLKSHHEWYGSNLYGVSGFVLDNLGQEEVPILTSVNYYAFCYWYEGTTGNGCADYYTWGHSFEEIWDRLQQNDVTYLVFLKDNYYADHADFAAAFEKLYEDEYNVVLKIR